MPTSAVAVEHVIKRFSGHTAVRDLSFEVPTGEIFGLLGPNGAGKSTTIRMIMDIIEPDEGQYRAVRAEQLVARPLQAGRLSPRGARPLQEDAGARAPRLPGGDQGTAAARTPPAGPGSGSSKLGLADWALKKVEDLSKGMQQKIQFAGALLHDPDLVILDEPFSGLDPVNLQVMKDTVVDIARNGRTVLFSTHVMEQAERMCDRIVIIARGEKVVDGTVAEVKADSGFRHIALSFAGGKEAAAPVLADRALVAKVDDYGASAEVELAAGADPQALLRALVERGVALSRFEIVEPSLQSIFIAKVGDASEVPAREAA